MISLWCRHYCLYCIDEVTKVEQRNNLTEITNGGWADWTEIREKSSSEWKKINQWEMLERPK